MNMLEYRRTLITVILNSLHYHTANYFPELRSVPSGFSLQYIVTTSTPFMILMVNTLSVKISITYILGSRISGEYIVALFITPSSQEMESPVKPGRFKGMF